MENSDPSISNIVETNGALEWVLWAGRAVRVVLVPVHALLAAVCTGVESVLVVHVAAAAPLEEVDRPLALGVADSIRVEEAGSAPEKALITLQSADDRLVVVLAVVGVQLERIVF